MIVKCTSLQSATGHGMDESPWLKVGREYVVLSIDENSQGERYYAIEPHYGHIDSLGFFSALGFEVIDKNWPQSWVEESVDDEISIAPKAWHRAGFWEDFHDGSLQAVSQYEEEKDKIMNK